MAENIQFAAPLPGSSGEILFSDGSGGASASVNLHWGGSSLNIVGVIVLDIDGLSPGASFLSANCPAGGSYGFSVADTASIVLTQFPTHGGEVLVTLGAQTIGGVKTFTPNIMVNLAGDLFSRFGPAPTTAAFTDGIDVLCAVSKQSGTTVGARAIFGAVEYSGGGSSAQPMQAVVGNASTITGSLGALTSSSTGGGLRNRFVCATNGSGVVTQASGVTGAVNATSGDITNSAAFHAEAANINSLITMTSHSGLWVRTGSISGVMTTWYGVRIDSPSAGTTKYQIGIDGVGVGTGIYFNTPTAAGTEYIRSTSNGDLDLNAATAINIRANGTANLIVSSTVVTFGLTFQPSASNTLDVGSTSRRIRRGYFGTQVDINVSTGTAPLIIVSTTVCTNLNADMVDGVHVGTSGNTIPKNNTANTFSANQTIANSGKTSLTIQDTTGGAAWALYHQSATFAIENAGSSYISVTTAEVVINDSSNDCNFRVESNGNANCLFVDAGTDRVGILNNAPGFALDVTGTINVAGTTGNLFRWNAASTAPGTTATPVFTSFYGGNTIALGDPLGWALLNIAGTDRKIPFYAV